MPIFSSCTLRSLCIENEWFYHGTNTQYAKLFELNNAGATIAELALVIYICSDCSRESIEKTLQHEAGLN